METHLKSYIYIVVAMMLLMASCANRGQGPQGGPRDTIPPKVLKESPLNGVLAYQGKKIEVTFDEYIQLDDIQNNVLISPPQQNPPEVKAVGKTLAVTFQEPLQDSTTYTINFGAAICDYNEKVPLEGYVFAFSTGDHIDSLAISGRVYDAATLNPKPAVLVGIHRNTTDSALSVSLLPVWHEPIPKVISPFIISNPVNIVSMRSMISAVIIYINLVRDWLFMILLSRHHLRSICTPTRYGVTR